MNQKVKNDKGQEKSLKSNEIKNRVTRKNKLEKIFEYFDAMRGTEGGLSKGVRI